jgi:hypothetical protein
VDVYCYKNVTGPTLMGPANVSAYTVSSFYPWWSFTVGASVRDQGNDLFYSGDYYYAAFIPRPTFSALPTPSPSQVTFLPTPLPPAPVALPAYPLSCPPSNVVPPDQVGFQAETDFYYSGNATLYAAWTANSYST